MRFNLKFQGKQRWLRRSLFLLASLTFVFTLLLSKASLAGMPESSSVQQAQAPHIAQALEDLAQPKGTSSNAPQRPRRHVRRSGVWQEVYKQLPYLPKADQYRLRDGGGDSSSTFVQRFILYHERKGRSVYHRFDWKLTLADYLEANEFIRSPDYPSSNRLKPDPLEDDRAIVAQLNRAQRDELVNSLVSLYYPRLPAPARVTDESLGEVIELSPQPDPIPPSTPARPSPPPSAQPGDAQLLLP